MDAPPPSTTLGETAQQIAAAVQAFKAVIHDGKTADEALAAAGLTGEGD